MKKKKIQKNRNKMPNKEMNVEKRKDIRRKDRLQQENTRVLKEEKRK